LLKGHPSHEEVESYRIITVGHRTVAQMARVEPGANFCWLDSSLTYLLTQRISSRFVAILTSGSTEKASRINQLAKELLIVHDALIAWVAHSVSFVDDAQLAG
jgi:hypothetical protein